MNNIMAESEWSLMRVLWTIDDATSKQLSQIMAEKKAWSPSTTKTILKRLQDKQLIIDNGESRNRRFKPCVDEKEMMTDNLNSLLNDMCAMKIGDSLVAALVNRELSQDDINKLINMLEKKALNAPKHIMCNCLPENCQKGCN